MREVATRRTAFTVMVLALALLLSSCGSEVSTYSFAFKTSEPADSYDERVVTVEHDVALAKLDVTLKIDQGDVTVRLDDAETGDWIWQGVYDRDQTFVIEVENLKASGTYRLSVSAKQAKEVSITVKTEVTLEEPAA